MSNVSRLKIYNRKVLVDPFQLRLVGVAIFHFVLVIGIFAGALFIPIIIRLDSGSLTSPQVQSAAHEFLILHTRLWAPLFGAFLLLVLHHILVSHRVAGPLYRFRRYLKAVGNGDLSASIRVRGSDYLQKEARVATHMVDLLRNKVTLIENRLEEANATWADLRDALPGVVADEIEQKATAMDDSLEDCKASVRVFKTGNERTAPVKRPTQPTVEPVEIEV